MQPELESEYGKITVEVPETDMSIGYMYGNIRDTVSEHIVCELKGNVSSDCILPLSPGAKEYVFGLIKEAWTR